MSRIFNQVVLAGPDDMELLEDQPDAEDFAFAEAAENDKQAAFDGSRGV
jgi:hypothetical protein